MNLEDEVCSLELAKKLKELGINENSLFYYLNIDGEGKYYIYYHEHIPEDFEYEGDPIPAFTVAELGEMLPAQYSSIRDFPNESVWKSCGVNNVVVKVNTKSDNEADTRAKMLIYLIENGLMKDEK